MIRRFGWLTMVMALGLTLLLATGCGQAPSLPTATPTSRPTRGSETVFPYIYYTPSEDFSQSLSVFFPDEAASFPDKYHPVIFLAHGWRGGKKGVPLWEVINFVNDLGYAAVSIDYRDDPTSGGHWTALNDSVCALAWVFANAADYGFDVERMVAFGHSSGAVLISVMATADDNREFLHDCPHQLPAGKPFLGAMPLAFPSMGVSGPGLWFGTEQFAKTWASFLHHEGKSWEEIYELSQALIQVPPLEWAKNDEFTEEERRLAKLQPVYWVDPSDPPFLVMWGENDKFMNWSEREAEAFVEILASVGVPATYVLLPGGTHSYLGPDKTAWQEPMEQFLRDVISEE